MFSLKKALALATLSAAVIAAPAALAGDDINAEHFRKMCDANSDGMVTKAEAMKAIEKMFDKHDTQKKQMLDKAQFDRFLKELMKSSG